MTNCFAVGTCRVAAYAKKHLEIGRSYSGKLPKHAHRALLLAVEAEKYLADLEEHNFNPFNETFRRKSHFKIPFRMLQHAKKGTY